MNSIQTWLQGRKTYLVGAAAILGAIAAYASGAADATTTGQAILTAILTMTLRAGVQKAQDAAKGP